MMEFSTSSPGQDELAVEVGADAGWTTPAEFDQRRHVPLAVP
jgi:hypothetical protein